MGVSRGSQSRHRSVTAGLLLGVVLLLNAAVVLPALHALGHDEHGCQESECVVAAMARGSVDPTTPPAPDPRPVGVALPVPVIPFGSSVSREDCPRLPARAPPV